MRITAKQEAFADAVAGGANYSDAYRAAYNTDNTTDKSINEAASRLMTNVKVKARIAEQKAKLEQQDIVTRAEMLRKLLDVEQDCKLADDKGNRIRAIDSINKMLGYNEPDKLQLDTDIRINVDDD